MYKLLKTLFLSLLIACLLLPTLASCGKCKHKESEWVDEIEATCSVAGTRVKKCTECGAELDREQYSTNHLYEEGACIYCGRAQYGSEFLEYAEITLDGEEGYEVIGYGNSNAKAVEIPALRNGKPVLSVRARAFYNNQQITSVTFGKNVKKIGESAFYGCKVLESVTFHENSEAEVIGAAAFAECVLLKAFSVPSGVSVIPAQMLRGCTALNALTLHSGITSIGESALEGCDAITYSEENGAKYLGAADVPHLLLLEVIDKSITSFTVPADTRIIGTSAFRACTKLTSISLPEGVLALSPYAFSACTSLESVTLPSTLVAVGTAAFAGCTLLESLTLPSGVLHIGEKAFYQCRALTALELPSDVKTVGALAFLQTGLSHVTWEGGRYLGNAENPYLVFVGIESDLLSLTIHENTRVVANGAMAGTSAASLISVTVGANVVTLGAGAFLGCESLEALVFSTQDGWKIATVYGVNPISIVVDSSEVTAGAIVGIHKNDYWYR